MMAPSYTPITSMDSKDSEDAEAYWLRTVLDDRAESAPPPAPPGRALIQVARSRLLVERRPIERWRNGR